MRMATQVPALLSGVALTACLSAAQLNGQLPLYPNSHNMNDMPAAPAGMGIPMVLETDDPVQKVDTWYIAHLPKACAHTSAPAGIKYACPSGSIMIYPHQGKTQIAFVPSLAHP
jgi:hypothetical protein